MLKIINVNKKIKEKVILENINMEFLEGNITGIMGSNGSSKTMLLNVIAGNLKIDSGEIKLPSKNISGCIGKINLIEDYTVNEILNEITKDKEKIKKILDRFNIRNFENTKIKKLSLGTKQKVWISTILCEESDVYLLDEPFNSLDENSINILKNILIELKKENKIIIIVSHNKNDMDICNKIYTLENGKVISESINENYAEDSYVENKVEYIPVKNSKKIVKYILIIIICVLIILYFFFFKINLNKAISLKEEGRYDEAYEKINKFIYLPNIKEIEEIKLNLMLNKFEDGYKRSKDKYILFLDLKNVDSFKKTNIKQKYIKICEEHENKVIKEIEKVTDYNKQQIFEIIKLEDEKILEIVGK